MAIYFVKRKPSRKRHIGNVPSTIGLTVAHVVILRGTLLRQRLNRIMCLTLRKSKSDKTMERMKVQAKTSQESTHQIVSSTLRGTSTAVAGQLPPVRSIKQTIR